MPEPNDGKLSCSVLRGLTLPDIKIDTKMKKGLIIILHLILTNYIFGQEITSVFLNNLVINRTNNYFENTTCNSDIYSTKSGIYILPITDILGNPISNVLVKSSLYCKDKVINKNEFITNNDTLSFTFEDCRFIQYYYFTLIKEGFCPYHFKFSYDEKPYTIIMQKDVISHSQFNYQKIIWQNNIDSLIAFKYNLINTIDSGFLLASIPIDFKLHITKFDKNGKIQWTNKYSNILVEIPTTNPNDWFSNEWDIYNKEINRLNKIDFTLVLTNDNYILVNQQNSPFCLIDLNGNLILNNEEIYKLNKFSKNILNEKIENSYLEYEKIIKINDNIFFNLKTEPDSSYVSCYNVKLSKLNDNGDLIWEKKYKSCEQSLRYSLFEIEIGYIIVINNSFYNYTSILTTDLFGKIKYETKLDIDIESCILSHDNMLVCISSESKFYKIDFSLLNDINENINPLLTEWEQKGVYEKLIDYQIRVNDLTRKQKKDELIKTYLNSNCVSKFEYLSKPDTFEYDTESELFKIEFDYFGIIYVPVIINEAADFGKNIKNLIYSDYEFGYSDIEDRAVLNKLTIKNPFNNKLYFYNSNTINEITFINKKDSFNYSITNQEYVSVDENIPIIENNYLNRFALIIGNENYIANGGIEADVTYALNDARTFKKYAISTLGIPVENIIYLENGTRTQMRENIELFLELMNLNATNREFYIYYAGHGLPDENNDAYLMPVDIKQKYIEDAFKLSDLYADLIEKKPKKVVVFLDACFSGGGRTGDNLIAARSGVRIKPNNESISGNLLVFAAASENQVSKPYETKQHGMFTYYLLKAIQDSNGIITYDELTSQVINNVSTYSLTINKEKQTPVVNISTNISTTWEIWKLNE